MGSTSCQGINVDYPSTYDTGPLPDCVTTLLLAQCDPNIRGNPSLSPLGTAIRRGEEHTVEVLFQFRADLLLRGEREELPLQLPLPEEQLSAFRFYWTTGLTRGPQCRRRRQDPTVSGLDIIDMQLPWI